MKKKREMYDVCVRFGAPFTVSLLSDPLFTSSVHLALYQSLIALPPANICIEPRVQQKGITAISLDLL